jgi:hypothetical protein
MNDPITVDRGFVHVDAHAWVEQRVGEAQQALTTSLSDFGHHVLFAEYPLDRLDWMARAELWCAARGYPVDEGQPIELDDEVLTRRVSVLCAATDTREAIVVVSVNDAEPTVYPDRTTDPGYWRQADHVDLACTECADRWTWYTATGTLLVLDTGVRESSIADVFGYYDSTPFAPCAACAAFESGESEEICDGDHEPRIICPTCGADCQLQLTEIPVHEPAPSAG